MHPPSCQPASRLGNRPRRRLAYLVLLALALLIVFGLRTTATAQRKIVRVLVRFVTLGYAMPGAVIAVGCRLPELEATYYGD